MDVLRPLAKNSIPSCFGCCNHSVGLGKELLAQASLLLFKRQGEPSVGGLAEKRVKALEEKEGKFSRVAATHFARGPPVCHYAWATQLPWQGSVHSDIARDSRGERWWHLTWCRWGQWGRGHLSEYIRKELVDLLVKVVAEDVWSSFEL